LFRNTVALGLGLVLRSQFLVLANDHGKQDLSMLLTRTTLAVLMHRTNNWHTK